MHQLLTDQSLKEFIETVELPEEKQKEFFAIIPRLNEEGRILLFDTLTKYYTIDSEEKRVEKIIELYQQYAKDSDYDKLSKGLEELETIPVVQ